MCPKKQNENFKNEGKKVVWETSSDKNVQKEVIQYDAKKQSSVSFALLCLFSHAVTHAARL